MNVSFGSEQNTSEAILETRKLEKFRALVKHANTHSAYYQRLINERGINPATCKPQDFPLLTKNLLMANFDEIVTDRRITKQAIADFLTRSTDPGELFLDKYTVMHTSGSSGEVGYFLTTNAEMRRAYRGLRRAARGRARLWPIKELRRLRIAFYGVTAVTRMQKGLARLFLKTHAFEVNSPLPDVVAQLNAFQPDFLFGYTTALKMLGEQQRVANLRLKPVAIAATGEMVIKEDVLYLKESFTDAQVFSVYACTEHQFMGVSNPDH